MSLSPKTFEQALATHKPLSRKKGLRASGFPRKPVSTSEGLKASGRGIGLKRGINKAGPRTKAWAAVWKFLKAEFYKRGRTHCEFEFIEHDCWGALYPCHSKKRREMQGDDIYAVATGCQQMARYLDEDLSHEEMEQTVMRAINQHGGLILSK